MWVATSAQLGMARRDPASGAGASGASSLGDGRVGGRQSTVTGWKYAAQTNESVASKTLMMPTMSDWSVAPMLPPYNPQVGLMEFK